MAKPVIIALDYADGAAAQALLTQFSGEDDLWIKVGMELFYREGPQFITALRSRGYHVFLDLKLYDIPHTVHQAMQQIGRLGAELTTVTGLGGADMISAAKEGLLEGAAEAGTTAPKLLAITQLTSMDEQAMHVTMQNDDFSLLNSVVHLAQLAATSGADGVISSALEVGKIHDATPAGFLTITPGIRLAEDARDDQSRVVTPRRAAELGSDGIVVGRSITQAKDPVAAYHAISQQFEGSTVY
ncbi:orotidine-5'-phosphate decarboxylase [Schleiferilactobacillus perolens]|jgi:orotidine-5'-phosphate decarboxylase|nr:orotidine-5'-phosphate decarboxylase [Schleiferilactobacillus perolens]MCI1891047.1 orotidine-5'-phosphate decarboxylase [Schleiferilactobacillus harbinensis]MCI1913388.1 orotidine-5'-phosphate decarboxylase [Schleiferilactobacillus harbinensis]MCI2170372.1 orotidine-5'-phosphate decarboxylase [Schleiferilactobacillus perolens]